MVVIAPRIYIFEGVADPERAEFTATLSDTDDISKGPAEEVLQFVGAEAAVAWGRERAEIVLVTLDGHWDRGTSFSAGEEPWLIAGIHDAPLPPWPGSGNIETPPGGWYEPPDADTFARVEAEIRKQLEAGPPMFFTQPQRRPDDPISRPEPPPSTRLQATFKWEETAEDGEDIGPLIVFDPDERDVIWESPDWVRVSEARALAEAKGWQFGIDG